MKDLTHYVNRNHSKNIKEKNSISNTACGKASKNKNVTWYKEHVTCQKCKNRLV